MAQATVAPATAQAPTAASPPSAADFAKAPAMQGMSISPDGKHIAALTSSNGVDVTLSVWEADAPQKAPLVTASTRMRFISVEFIKNDRLLVTAIQPYTAGDTKRHLTKQYVADLAGANFRSILPERAMSAQAAAFVGQLVDAEVISKLPDDPQNVLVRDNRLEGDGDIYRVNIYNGQATRVERAAEDTVSQVDLKGEIRGRQKIDFDNGALYIAQLIKNPENGRFEEHFRSYARDRELVGVVGFDPDPNIAYVSASRGKDKTGIYAYDIKQKKFLEPLFEHKLFDAVGVIQSRAPADFGAPIGFQYAGARTEQFWLDEKLKDLIDTVRRAAGVTMTPVDWTDPGTGEKARFNVAEAADIQLQSLSNDRSRAILTKSGPKQPTEYYLYKDGQVSLLGKSRPWISPDALGEAKLVQYTARDGLVIPAFLTMPPARFGAGPHPAIVLPHGGPWARDDLVWDISGWTQYFASRGYAVLQPQFRGSEGWGQKLWRAGDGEWGQKMQDDKDDGAKWLIDQKIADPQRIAMFGYSYGGYAALAATIRPNGLYQCAVSGAGAGDLASIGRATFRNRFQREFQNPTIRGLDALQSARQAKIPVFIYHGDRDQTVELRQSKRFAEELSAAGLPHKFLEIKDMGHGYVTMTPAMMEQQLVEIEKYLKSDCGPGGL